MCTAGWFLWWGSSLWLSHGFLLSLLKPASCNAVQMWQTGFWLNIAYLCRLILILLWSTNTLWRIKCIINRIVSMKTVQVKVELTINMLWATSVANTHKTDSLARVDVIKKLKPGVVNIGCWDIHWSMYQLGHTQVIFKHIIHQHGSSDAAVHAMVTVASLTQIRARTPYPLRNSQWSNCRRPGTTRPQAKWFPVLQQLPRWELCNFSMGMGFALIPWSIRVTDTECWRHTGHGIIFCTSHASYGIPVVKQFNKMTHREHPWWWEHDILLARKFH